MTAYAPAELAASFQRRPAAHAALPVISHGVAVRPGWECNAPMRHDWAAELWECATGHIWTREQLVAGETRRPWRHRNAR